MSPNKRLVLILVALAVFVSPCVWRLADREPLPPETDMFDRRRAIEEEIEDYEPGNSDCPPDTRTVEEEIAEHAPGTTPTTC